MSSRSIEPSGSNRRQPHRPLKPSRSAGRPKRPRFEAPRRSRRLSRGPQSIATVGTGVTRRISRPIFRQFGQSSESHANCARLRHLPESPQALDVRSRRGCMLNKHCLLKLNLGADFFEGRLDLGGLVLVDAFLDVFGAPSTKSLASLRPRPVMARTSLMTSIFLSPAAARTTVNSVFSSAAGAAARRGAGRNRNRGSSGNAPLLFKKLGKFGRLEHCEARRGRLRFSADQP